MMKNPLYLEIESDNDAFTTLLIISLLRLICYIEIESDNDAFTTLLIISLLRLICYIGTIVRPKP